MSSAHNKLLLHVELKIRYMQFHFLLLLFRKKIREKKSCYIHSKCLMATIYDKIVSEAMGFKKIHAVQTYVICSTH